MEKVMYEFPKMFRVFITKRTSKFCGTNWQLSRSGDLVKGNCPSCGEEDESSKHVTDVETSDGGQCGAHRFKN